ncbi:conserved hypothetical protein [Leishmania major strain Friedlin]|uniref:Uncharacterized protein n=1 Tax=Leishmania major TaxID=5664 RepID=Q4QAY8_LEIMA|nr:conserved hypothetical protein [Leishmania major strain Friedlin]CAG9574448.1 hypothetical_protein_-_conserved [Leishmania major strain Friedlin]CAJ05073.1 conserved hypothetical protein [Leishmania major strain Friedlin]|eukprot:XP_001683510.1 conserved hypothetical protein [Leishmania major strain Friedlin]
MSASSTVSDRRVCIFFDCRVAGDGKGYEELRQTVYAQCSQLLTLSYLHYQRSGTTLSATVHLVTHTRVESFATPFCATSTDHPIDSGAAGVISGLRALAAAQPDHSVNACGAAIFGNRMESVLPHVQRALGGSQQRHQLILFCSSYVSHTEATQSLSGLCLDASPHQRLRCILVDWEAVCVTVGELASNVRVYRCSRSARQLQAAMQEILSLFLLPDVRSSRRLGLQLGLQAVPVIATISHYGAFLDGRDTIGSVVATDRASSAAAPMAGGVMHQRLAETNHRHNRANAASVVERDDRDPWSTLHLRAVLEADNIDESFLMGDTWTLALDTSAASTSTLTSSSAPSWPCTASTVALWHAFCNAFLGDALVFTGEETGIEAHRHAMQRHHHFVAYFMPDRTMRVREIVPPELRFVPLPAFPTREGLREQKAYTTEMQRLREQLVSHCACASFSLDALLSSGGHGAASTP